MYPAVDTKDPSAVEMAVQAAYLDLFPGEDPNFVPCSFRWARDFFSGQYRDYQPVDALYHDLEHTLQGALCMARLLRGRQKAGTIPALGSREFQLGLLGILMHDTGYLKKRDDTEGTGAKYTITHVSRSAEFAAHFLRDKGFDSKDVRAVQNMIHCTGVEVRLSAILFQNEIEKIVGCALGTADLLGQMAAEDYVDKLPILYQEFAEAAQYSAEPHFIGTFSSATDLMERTPSFWENFVWKKLEQDFGGLHHFLNDPYPKGPNSYLRQIEMNLDRLREKLAAQNGKGSLKTSEQNH
jgi:hypothetical protein